LKIAYILTRSDLIGGVQVHVRDLAVSMAQRGHEPAVLVGAGGPFLDSLRAAGVPTFPLQHLAAAINPVRDTRAIAEIHSILKRWRPDFVSTHSSKAGVLGRMAARALGIPVVFTAHGWAFTPGVPGRQAWLYRAIERAAAPLANRIITVSEFDRQLAIARLSQSPARIVTVHNGMPDVGASFRADPGRSPVRLIMIARFEPQKDHSTLLEALAQLTHLSWTLDLVGDGPLLPQVQATSRVLGIGERIRFWGQRGDVPERLADAQVALLITNWEGFPRSILEAMRAGLPVIASEAGGSSESVQHGTTGFIVPKGGTAELKSRLEDLITSPELRVRLGKHGRARYEQEFTLSHTIDKTLRVYQELVAEAGIRGRPTAA
jgi:glycosyltransferase involved in cell wall biosynthesis